MPVDRLDVDPLLQVADGDDGLQRRAEGAFCEELRQRDRGVFLGDADRGRDVADAQRIAPGQEVRQAGQQPASGVLVGSLAQNGNLAAARLETDAEGGLDGSQVFVGDSEERGQSGVGQGYGVG